FSDIPNLVYTRQVVDEVLRLYPPAWGVGRLALEDDEIDGYHIPKGTNFIIVAFLAHRRPEIWEDPLAFKPERWADNFARKLPKFAYFPFGGGPRMCIGNNFALMEMTILLATLAQHFNPKLTPDAFPEYDSLITLRPKGEVPMRFV
ncbi:MAG: cytochrome P450, partial [Bacteroidota bacterium]